MTSRVVTAAVVAVFASIGAWVAGRALGGRLAGPRRREPARAPEAPAVDIEDALEIQ